MILAGIIPSMGDDISWLGTLITSLFVIMFIIILVWVIKGNKRLYSKHAKMPLDNNTENENSPDKN